MKIAVCQVPDIREDISSAVLWLKRSSNEAAAADTGLVCLPECFLQGYLTNERTILIPLKEDRFEIMAESHKAYKLKSECIKVMKKILYGIGDTLMKSYIIALDPKGNEKVLILNTM